MDRYSLFQSINYRYHKTLPIIDQLAVEQVEVDISQDLRESWENYRSLVWRLTNEQPLRKLKNFNKRGFKNYHLDHKISIWYGWKNDLSPESIANIGNLRMIRSEENEMKGRSPYFDQSNAQLQFNLSVQ